MASHYFQFENLCTHPNLGLIAAGLLAEKQRKNDRAAARYRRLTQVAPRDPEGYYLRLTTPPAR